MNKIEFIKLVDRIAGRALVFILARSRKFQKIVPDKIERILIIRPGGIGDAVLLLPSVTALKARFPGAGIDLLCEKRNAGVFGLSTQIDHIYSYDKGLELFRCMKNKYDVVIDTEQWHRLSAVVAYLTGAPVKIGFDTNERRTFFTHQVPYSHDEYEADSFLHLIEPLAGEDHKFDVDMPFVEISRIVTPYLSSGREVEVKGMVAMFPGASVAERRWGGERFGEAARSLNENGYRVLILGSQADRSEAEIIQKYAPASVNLIGKTSLVDVAGLLKECKLLITSDSGIMHLAYAVGTPTLSLFGPGIEEKWAPKGKKHRSLNVRLDCSPCTRFGYTPTCEKDVLCLSSLRVKDLLDAVYEMLNEKSND